MAVMNTLLLVCAALVGCGFALAAGEAEKLHTKTFFRDVPRPTVLSANKGEDDDGRLRIWNGDIAKEGQFPYYVAVYQDMNYFCGGSLIHPKWVLTAAHCVAGTSIWTMFMGVLNLQLPKEDGREVHVSRGGILHPQYDDNLITNDIGLVQLMNRVTLSTSTSKRIGLVTLTPAGKTYLGQKPTVAGFGVTSDSLGIISPELKYTSMPIVSSDICYDRYGSADDSQICLDTSTVKTSSCSGDSGGPLVIYDANNVPTLIGATSFGSSAGCTLGLPVGFTNVAKFIDWIAESTGIPYPFDQQQ